MHPKAIRERATKLLVAWHKNACVFLGPDPIGDPGPGHGVIPADARHQNPSHGRNRVSPRSSRGIPVLLGLAPALHLRYQGPLRATDFPGPETTPGQLQEF